MAAYRTHLTAAAALLVVAAGASAQVTVTVDASREYQTIEGFGGHGAADVWWSGGPFYTASFGNTFVDDIGFTMNRNVWEPDWEPSNENGDPNGLDMARLNINGAFGTKQKAYLIAMRDKAAASGEPIRFISSIWSPPTWMKVSGSLNGGNAATNVLKDGVQSELAEYVLSAVRAYKEQCNIDLYAFSLQNEPAFDEPYHSCVYTPTLYRETFKAVATKVHATYPDLKFFGAEHMLANWGTFEGALSSDSTARHHVGAFAVHGYSDGVHPTSASQAAGLWRRAATNCASAGKPLWMTETSGYFDTWTDCFKLAETIYGALKYGKLAAWVWWQLGGGADLSEYNLMSNTTVSPRAYVHKHFARFIRPGAVMVDCTPSDTLVFGAAFVHKANRTLSIVLINSTGASKTVTLSGANLPQFNVYRSTSTETCVAAGTAINQLTMPASSVVTLFGQNYSVGVAPRADAGARIARGPAAAREYTLDGRRVNSSAMRQGVPAVVVRSNAEGVTAPAMSGVIDR